MVTRILFKLLYLLFPRSSWQGGRSMFWHWEGCTPFNVMTTLNFIGAAYVLLYWEFQMLVQIYFLSLFLECFCYYDASCPFAHLIELYFRLHLLWDWWKFVLKHLVSTMALIVIISNINDLVLIDNVLLQLMNIYLLELTASSHFLFLLFLWSYGASWEITQTSINGWKLRIWTSIIINTTTWSLRIITRLWLSLLFFFPLLNL